MHDDKERELRIGISLQGFCGWQGGIDFCMNFIRVLKDKNTKVYCFIPYCVTQGDWKQKIILGLEVIRNNKNVKIIYYESAQLAYVLKKYSIDIAFPLFGSSDYIKDIPCMGYIADLQHKRLVKYFSKQEIARRDREYTSILNKYKYVLVNSQSVKKDLERYYAPYKAQIVVLPCISIASGNHIPKMKLDYCLRKKYNLPQKYFMISNQFWLHKNHMLAFEAFDQFYKSGHQDIYLICTGKMEDNRDKQYISRLLKYKNQLSCKDNILLLGLIPKKDQLGIMRNAIALVQPTQFEGGPGGGSVYDAMAMQVPCIVSDIEINRELPKSKRIHYFDVESLDDLALKMEMILKEEHKKKSWKVLKQIRDKNLHRYKKILMLIIRKIMNKELICGN